MQEIIILHHFGFFHVKKYCNVLKKLGQHSLLTEIFLLQVNGIIILHPQFCPLGFRLKLFLKIINCCQKKNLQTFFSLGCLSYKLLDRHCSFPESAKKSIFSLKKIETDHSVVAGTKKKEEEEQWTEARLEKDPRKKVLRDLEKDKGCK